MKYIIETVSHETQRYPTVGDWGVNPDGSRWIKVSDMGNEDYAFLVALHEIIEQKLCERRGIKEEEVTKFDQTFEAMRKLYPDIIKDKEPGDDDSAPYWREHKTATGIEMALAQELGVDWFEYETKVNEL